jgi:KUP system potassium uptake protein
MKGYRVSPNIAKEPEDKKGAKRDTADRQLLKLSLAALGVVFGDIGTSPLYAIRECFYGEYGIAVNPSNILDVLSLMFWSLVMVVTFKYILFVLRADNQGEGGVMALTALIKSVTGKVLNSRLTLVSLGPDH